MRIDMKYLSRYMMLWFRVVQWDLDRFNIIARACQINRISSFDNMDQQLVVILSDFMKTFNFHAL